LKNIMPLFHLPRPSRILTASRRYAVEVLVVLCISLAALGFWRVIHLPVFSIGTINLSAGQPALRHIDELSLRQALLPGMNFFTADIHAVASQIKEMPWVRSVSLRRTWPNVLSAAIEEHELLGTWAADKLVSTSGVIFSGALSDQDFSQAPITLHDAMMHDEASSGGLSETNQGGEPGVTLSTTPGADSTFKSDSKLVAKSIAMIDAKIDGSVVPAIDAQPIRRWPSFDGPPESAPEIVARFNDLRGWLLPLGLSPLSLRKTALSSWTMVMNDGVTVEIGRAADAKAMKLRVDRLLQAYPAIYKQYGQRIDTVDLRYRNSVAVKPHANEHFAVKKEQAP
jgi:cell division septal protein FtsQ